MYLSYQKNFLFKINFFVSNKFFFFKLTNYSFDSVLMIKVLYSLEYFNLIKNFLELKKIDLKQTKFFLPQINLFLFWKKKFLLKQNVSYKLRFLSINKIFFFMYNIIKKKMLFPKSKNWKKILFWICKHFSSYKTKISSNFLKSFWCTFFSYVFINCGTNCRIPYNSYFQDLRMWKPMPSLKFKYRTNISPGVIFA